MQKLLDGSFYQYFDSKEDLLIYIMKKHSDKLEKYIGETIKKTNGNIFLIFISIYDYMLEECLNKKDGEFYKNIFKNLRENQEDFFFRKNEIFKRPDLKKFIKLIDKTGLNISDKEDIKDIERIINILFGLTKKAVISNYKYPSKEIAREEYLKSLEILKYGILKR